MSGTSLRISFLLWKVRNVRWSKSGHALKANVGIFRAQGRGSGFQGHCPVCSQTSARWDGPWALFPSGVVPVPHLAVAPGSDRVKRWLGLWVPGWSLLEKEPQWNPSLQGWHMTRLPVSLWARYIQAGVYTSECQMPQAGSPLALPQRESGNSSHGVWTNSLLQLVENHTARNSYAQQS